MKIKKLLSVLLALVMVLSMATMALAAPPGGMPPGGEGGMPPGGPGGGPGGPGGAANWELEDNQLSVWLKDGIVVDPNTEGATEHKVDRIVTCAEDNLSSFSGGGTTPEDDDYAFTTALYVKNGEVVTNQSVTEAISAGSYNGVSATGVVITSEYEGFNPIIVVDSEYTISGATLVIDSDGDGTVACDFSGLGAAIAAYGDETVLVIENSDIKVSGVGNLTLFADDGSDVIIKNTKLHSEGGTLHAGYKNSPNQATMVAPPWILGIMGSSRTTNLEGQNTSTTVIDSEVSAAQWAVLSTDAGSNMQLNVVNTVMTLTGADYALQADGTFTTEYGETGSTANPYTDRSGYGTYTIGSADERFYGVTQNVGTYANIYTGGIGLYTAMKKGEAIELLDANDNVLMTYVPAESKITTINSDTFGFMIHQGTNELVIEEGTVVNSGYTTFLLKTGCSMDADITSGTVLNPGNGIILQVMDNDDATTGMDISTFSFYTEHTEYAGWPTKGGSTGSNVGDFTFTDVTLTGDIFNASGYEANSVGAQPATALKITLNGTTTLAGQISSTSAIHVTKEGSDAVKAAAAGQKASENWLKYQLTSFPIGEYWNIGQVANKVYTNGVNTIDVIVADKAVWTVTAGGIVNNLTADSDAIVAEAPVTLTVNGTLTLDGKVVTEDTTVGNVTYDVKEVTTYTVVKGDTLWGIAAKHLGSGFKWSALYEVNKGIIKNPNLIFVGQILEIPAK